VITYAKRVLLVSLLLAVSACTRFNTSSLLPSTTQPEHLTVKVIAKISHDTTAFTEGLVWADGKLYESAGLYSQSTLREVDAQTGKVLRKTALPAKYFAEGLSLVGSNLIQLTWQEHTAFVYDRSTLSQISAFTYTGEGWGQCYDGTQIYMSDGSATITVRDPKTFSVVRQFQVTEASKPIDQLNELECVGDLLYENVWHSNNILEIDKLTGVVTAVIDASELLTSQEATTATSEGVLNGIAYDTQKQDFIITGKQWPWMFEVQFVEAS